MLPSSTYLLVSYIHISWHCVITYVVHIIHTVWVLSKNTTISATFFTSFCMSSSLCIISFLSIRSTKRNIHIKHTQWIKRTTRNTRTKKRIANKVIIGPNPTLFLISTEVSQQLQLRPGLYRTCACWWLCPAPCAFNVQRYSCLDNHCGPFRACISWNRRAYNLKFTLY